MEPNNFLPSLPRWICLNLGLQVGGGGVIPLSCPIESHTKHIDRPSESFNESLSCDLVLNMIRIFVFLVIFSVKCGNYLVANIRIVSEKSDK